MKRIGWVDPDSNAQIEKPRPSGAFGARNKRSFHFLTSFKLGDDQPYFSRVTLRYSVVAPRNLILLRRVRIGSPQVVTSLISQR